MAGKRPYFPFYPGDWLRDPVACCSVEAQGLWLRMMITMHDREPYGHLAFGSKPMPPEAIAQACGVAVTKYEKLLRELTAAGVPRVTDTGIIYSKRMVDDELRRNEDAARKSSSRSIPSNVRKMSDECPANVRRTSAGKEDEDEDDKSLSSRKGDTRGKPTDFPPELDTPEFREVWTAYIRFRSEQKFKPLGATSVGQKFRQFAEWGPDRASAAIRHSMANGWQGIFEEKANGGGSNGKHSGSARLSGWERREQNAAREFPENIKLPIA